MNFSLKKLSIVISALKFLNRNMQRNVRSFHEKSITDDKETFPYFLT